MIAPPMRAWQTALGLLAAAPVAVALLPLPAPVRIAALCVAAAVVLCLLALRMRAHGQAARRRDHADVMARIERMRAARDARYRRGR